MITNPFLRKIVEESNRRFITTSMIVEAEEEERKANRELWKRQKTAYQKQIAALRQGQRALSLSEIAQLQQQQAMSAASAQYSGDLLGILLGGAFGGYLSAERCPYCGK